jgi:hypothetical protein
VYPTDRDVEIFKLFRRYRYLPSDYIHAFVGGNKGSEPSPESSFEKTQIEREHLAK